MDESTEWENEADGIDIDLVRAEINAEADKWRRRDPEIPLLERKIEQAWLDIAPPGAVNSNDQFITRFNRLAKVDTDPPDDQRRHIRHVKLAIHKGINWYMQYLVGQINSILQLLTKCLDNIESRINYLENTARSHVGDPRVLELIPELSRDTVDIVANVVGMRYCAVLSCGEGNILEAIYNRGGNGYGIEQDPQRTLIGTKRGLDIRKESVIEHMGNAEDSSLQAIVLTGVVEAIPIDALLTLPTEIDRVLANSGIAVIAVAELSSRSVAESELLFGCGASPHTWQYILNQYGFATEIMETSDSRLRYLVVAQRR